MEKRNEKMMHVKLPISDDKGSEFLEWKENIWGCLPLSMFDPVHVTTAIEQNIYI